MNPLNWLRAALDVRRYFALAKWEANLEAQQRLLDRRQAEIGSLLQFDEQFRTADDRGIRFEVSNPTSATWADGSDVIDLSFQVSVLNRWIYPVKMHKLTGSAIQGSYHPGGDVAYLDDVRVNGCSAVNIHLKYAWKPSTQQRREFEDKRDATVWFQLQLRGYFRFDMGEEREVSQTCNGVEVRLQKLDG